MKLWGGSPFSHAQLWFMIARTISPQVLKISCLSRNAAWFSLYSVANNVVWSNLISLCNHMHHGGNDLSFQSSYHTRSVISRLGETMTIKTAKALDQAFCEHDEFSTNRCHTNSIWEVERPNPCVSLLYNQAVELLYFKTSTRLRLSFKSIPNERTPLQNSFCHP